jgi:hypothetical protein
VEHRNSQYALCAACMRGGLQPYLLSDAGWWQAPLWKWAVYAVVIYSRAAAERLAVSIAEIARRSAASHGLELIACPVVVTGRAREGRYLAVSRRSA